MRTGRLAVLGAALALTFGQAVSAQRPRAPPRTGDATEPDSVARELLRNARTIRCQFDSIGVETIFLDRLPPSSTRARGYSNPEIIDNIDRARSTATMISRLGARTVTVLPQPATGLHFLETTALGGDPVLTTVFAKRVAGSPEVDPVLLAVITRHLHWLDGKVIVSQHYGRCKSLFGE